MVYYEFYPDPVSFTIATKDDYIVSQYPLTGQLHFNLLLHGGVMAAHYVSIPFNRAIALQPLLFAVIASGVYGLNTL